MTGRVAVSAVVVAMLAITGVGIALVSTDVASTSAHASAASAPATARLVIRPVTQSGTAASGFHVTKQSGAVDCTTPDESAGAVNHDIERCSPSAAYAIACWKAAMPHRVLCTRDPSSHGLYSLPRTGNFAPAGLVAKRDRAPLLLVLGNGWRCAIRDGGAWNSLKAHPNWYGTYSCNNNHDAVWSASKAPHNGINESRSVWTVQTAPFSGNERLTVRTVRKAYFVGTHS